MDGELHALNVLAWRHDALGDPVELYATAGGEVVFALVVAALLIAGVRHRRALLAGLTALAAAGCALVAAGALSALIHRPRPFVADPAHVHLLVAHARDPGFPSDHATAAFAIATVVYRYDRRAGAAALAAAALLALARVVVGVHYLGDVLGGAALGIAAAIVVSGLVERRFAAPAPLVA